MKRKTLRRLVLIPLTSLVVLLGLLVAVAAFILTPQRLTPLVAGLCDRYLDAQVRFDTVDVALFRDFPYVTLQVRGAEIVSRAFRTLPDSVRQTLPAEADTLVRAGSIDVSLNPWKLISGRVDIRRIGLADTHLHAYVAPGGRANWDIYRSDTSAEADTTSSAFEVNINRFTVREGLHLVYDSRPDRVAASVLLGNLLVSGRLTTDLLQNDIQRLRLRDCAVRATLSGGPPSGVVIDSLTVDGRRRVDYTVHLGARDLDWDGHRWLDSVSLSSGLLFHGKDHKELAINGFDLRLNDMGVTAGGEVGFHGDSIAADLRVQTAGLRLADMLRVIPTDILPLARDYETNLTTDLDLRVNGGFNPATGTLPDVTAHWRIPDGYLYYTKGKYGSRIDTLALDATVRFRPRDPDSTGVDLRRLKLSGIGLSLEASGRVDRLGGDASFGGDLRGDLSLDYLAQHFPGAEEITARGRIGIDLHGAARFSELTPARIGAAKLSGLLRMDTLLVDLPKEDFHLMVGHGRLRVGTGLSASDTLIARGTQAVGVALTLDTVDMDLGRQLCVTGRRINVQVTTATRNLVRDTTAVHPSQGTLSAVGLRIDLGDSTVFVGRGIESQWSILPSPLSQSVPQLALDIQARRLSMREAENRFALRRAGVRLAATLYQPDSSAVRRRTARLDSLQGLYPGVQRDSLMTHVRALRGASAAGRQRADAFADNDLDLRLSSDLGELLRRWQVSGSVAATAGRVVTPYFPLATTLRDIDITFTTDEVHLNRTLITAGESRVVLTGGVSGLRRALLGRGAVRGNLTVDADTLNLNEIIRVVNAGASLVARGGVGQTENDDQMVQRLAASADTTTASGVLVVPGNIDMTFDLTIRHGAYANLRLDSLSGEVQARNRALHLSDLTMRSSAGDIRMTGLYSTRTPRDIQAGFDLEMENMKVARLIELIPSIDTLMPMLRSFDGVVDCQIALTTRLDSAMNVLLPSLNAACRLVGDSLVLMDGETFTEISKMLMFKNKKRNVIDHISAEMLVRDSQIEIFPFVVEIDRYRAAVSGIHRMDMTFDYHISVLKSPIPFRLGVDIFGNLDDFDFKIGRARYKSAELPSRVALIDSTRLNLRHYIREAFLRGPRAGDIASLRITPAASSPAVLLPPADSLSEEERAHIAADSTLRQKL